MDAITVFHNPACSKSRAALALLVARGFACDIVEYLRTPPDRATLEGLLARLPGAPAELVRHDSRFRELGLDAEAFTSCEQVVDLLLAHPELMERPVVVRGGRAILARPPERVLEILGD